MGVPLVRGKSQWGGTEAQVGENQGEATWACCVGVSGGNLWLVDGGEKTHTYLRERGSVPPRLGNLAKAVKGWIRVR